MTQFDDNPTRENETPTQTALRDPALRDLAKALESAIGNYRRDLKQSNEAVIDVVFSMVGQTLNYFDCPYAEIAEGLRRAADNADQCAEDEEEDEDERDDE